MTRLETLRKQIDDRLTAEMPGVLVERAVEYHCRKGLRSWCDCSYCKTKRMASWDIGKGHNTPKYAPPTPNYDEVTWYDRWEWKRRVNETFRESKRQQYRKRLNDHKKEL